MFLNYFDSEPQNHFPVKLIPTSLFHPMEIYFFQAKYRDFVGRAYAMMHEADHEEVSAI